MRIRCYFHPDGLVNVYEWTEDCVHRSLSFQGAPADGSAWTSGDCSSRVVHGGSWNDGNVRSAFSGWDVPVYRNNTHGFRVARTLSP